MSFDPLYSAVSWVLLRWHDALTLIGLDPAGGAGWTLSIVLLVVTARVLLLPVFVTQVRHQRRLDELRPRLAELRRRLGHDRAALQRHTLDLHREEGVNPFGGLAPALLQIPVFVGLVHVLRHLAKAAAPSYQAAFPDQLTAYGFTAAQTAGAGRADLAGAPLAATFRSSAAYVHDVLGGDVAATRWLLVGLLVLAAAATVVGQLLARRATATAAVTVPDEDATAATARRLRRGLLVVVPVVTLASELMLDFPLGVALYLATTSVWTCGQQAVATLLARRRVTAGRR